MAVWAAMFFSHVLAPRLVNLNNFRACLVLLLAGGAIPFLALRYPRGLTVWQWCKTFSFQSSVA